MKTSPSILVILAFTIFLSCEDPIQGIEEDKEYYMDFTVRNLWGDSYQVRVIQSDPAEVNRNGIKDSEFVAVGVWLFFSFVHPERDTINQALMFGVSFEIPIEEFAIDSGSYVFKEPAHLTNYIPKGNLFESSGVQLSTYFHEDLMTFCTASPNPSFENSFQINRAIYFRDENGQHAMDIEGAFELRYESFCQENDIGVEQGSFAAKVLIQSNHY
jgi:hypothetical protein